MSFHPVQLDILESLRQHLTGLRYRDMRVENTENDLYNYHLQHLVKQGLVEKNGNTYALTGQGKAGLMELHPLDHKFKLAALTLLTRDTPTGKEALYQKRLRQPFLGRMEIIGGGIQRGEMATAAATRRLQEEAGLQADFSLLGLVRKTRLDCFGKLYSDMLYHICISNSHTGDLVQSSRFGNHVWVPMKKAVEIEQDASHGSPQLATVLAKLERVGPEAIPLFYFEELYREDIS